MSNLNVATESIDFQNDQEFKSKLIAAMSEAKLFDYKKPMKKVEALIKERFGIPVRITSTPVLSSGPLVYIPDSIFFTPMAAHIDKNTFTGKAFLKKGAKEMEQIVAKSKTGIKIDRRKAYIEGFGKNDKFDIELPILDKYTSSITPPEMAATLLHEVGHIFAVYEFMGRVNYVDQAFYQSMISATQSSKFDKVRFIKTLKAKLPEGVGTKELNAFLDSSMPASASLALSIYTDLLMDAANTSISNLGLRTFHEDMADQFASRMGFARELASALAKYYKINNKFGLALNLMYRLFSYKMAFVIIKRTIKMGQTLFALAKTSLSLGIVIGAAISVYQIVSFLQFMNEESGTYPYRSMEDRLKFIRNEYLQFVKNMVQEGVFDPDRAKKVLEDIKDLDTMVNQFKFLPTPSVDAINYILSAGHRKAVRMQRSRDIMLDLANNPLYIKSLELAIKGDEK